MPTSYSRRLPVALAALGLIASIAAPVSGNSDSLPASELTTVFVELSSAPLAEVSGANEAAYLKQLAAEKENLKKAAKGARIALKERYSYSRLFNGVAVQVKPADLARLARLDGVKQIYPVETVSAPAPRADEAIEADLATAVEQTGAKQANELGYTGKGITVGVIDSGIDYTHPDLGGCTTVGPDCRVVGGYDFVGDSGLGTGGNWTPTPDNDPMDKGGHGTHVAGIVGAKGKVTGVAPEVSFRAYKVFDQGSSSADVIVAAMEQALADKVQIVNMSLGASYQWPNYPTARAANNLVNKGVVVIASQGNNGREGLFSGGAPGMGEKVISVASFDNSHTPVSKALLADGTAFGYGLMTYSPDITPLPATEIAVLPMSKLGCTASDFYVDGKSIVAGKIALVSRGTCSFGQKSANAKDAGAVAAIIHNNASGSFGGTLGAAGDHIPTVSISLEDGNLIRSKLPTTATFTAETFHGLNPAGGLISDFSSWGLAPDLTLKPDVGAPGGNILSTVPMAQGAYGVKGGTSMSAPHVAGVAAILLEANPKINSQSMRTVLQNTAKPVVYNKSMPYLLPTHRQGAGMVDVLAALDYSTKVEPSKLSLGEMAPGATATRTLTVENNTGKAVTYTVGHTQGLATGPATSATGNSFGLYANGATVSGSTVTVPAGGTAEVTVTFTAPTGLADRSIFTGWVTLTAEGASAPAVRVPYAGMAGDYQTVPVLNRNGYGFPWLASLSGTTYSKVSSLAIDLSQGQSAYLLVNYAHQAAKVRLSAVSASGKTYDRVYEQTLVGRHASPVQSADLSFFSPLTWDGTDRKGAQVPNGDYTLTLSVLKPLGDETNPAHWETWTSGTVTVSGSAAR